MSQQNSDPGAEIDALMNAYSSPAQRGEDALDAAAMGTGSEDRPTYKKQPRQPALNPEETYQSEAEQVEEEQEEAPVEEAPVEEKPDPYAEYEEPAEAEEEEMDELTQLKEQNKKLMQLLNNAVEESYQEQAQAQQRPLGTEEETEEDEQVRRSLPHAPIVPLLDDETFEQVTSDPKEFQKYLNGVVSAVQESSASIIPQAIHRILNTRTRMAAFFRKPENSDILPMMDYVRRVGLKVEEANPEKSIEEVLSEAAKQVRERIKVAQAPKAKPAAGQQPKFPGSSGARQRKAGAPPSQAQQGLLSELEEMEKTITRR